MFYNAKILVRDHQQKVLRTSQKFWPRFKNCSEQLGSRAPLNLKNITPILPQYLPSLQVHTTGYLQSSHAHSVLAIR